MRLQMWELLQLSRSTYYTMMFFDAEEGEFVVVGAKRDRSKMRDLLFQQYTNFKIKRSNKRCDCLICLPDSDWWVSRGDVRKPFFEDQGISTVYLRLPYNRSEDVEKQIQISKPSTVLIHAMSLTGEKVHQLADKFPKIKFLAINHSTQSHMVSRPALVRSNRDCILAALEKSNVFYFTPDERNSLGVTLGNTEKIGWSPNPVELPSTLCENPNRNSICLASREDIIKNTPQTLMAAKQVQDATQMKTYSLMNARAGEFDMNVWRDAYQIQIEELPWKKREDWLYFLSESVALTFQCSFTETFNYVAIESMLCGVPVVCSPAIRYAPKEWQANPDSVEEMRDIALKILMDHENQSKRATDIGMNYAHEMNMAYTEWVKKYVA